VHVTRPEFRHLSKLPDYKLQNISEYSESIQERRVQRPILVLGDNMTTKSLDEEPGVHLITLEWLENNTNAANHEHGSISWIDGVEEVRNVVSVSNV
jgi:hypothetical protein